MVIFPRVARGEAALIFTWAITMISLPIIIWLRDETVLPSIISALVIIQFLVVGIILYLAGGLSSVRGIIFAIPLVWLIEFTGSQTGFPFGDYSYTDALQPQAGAVPLLIPLAWAMMLPPAWGIASLLVKRKEFTSHVLFKLVRAGVAAAAFTAWDLFLDPLMVKWGFWVWKKPGIYFGVPFINLLSWFFISFVLSSFLIPDSLPTPALSLIYSITWMLLAVASFFFWNLPGPAIFGFLGMGSIIFWAFLRRK